MQILRTLAAVLSLSLVACAGGAPDHATSPANPSRTAIHARPVSPTPTPRVVPTAAPDRDRQRAALRARRQHHLEVLASYRAAGVFPINTSTPGDGHFLIDDRGTLCAVANLIATDGHRDQIVAAAQIDNGLRFGELSSGPFVDWILTSGFSQEEIARIQAPAPYVGNDPELILEPMAQPPVIAANLATARWLEAIEQALRADEAGLEVALDRLAGRPELVASLFAAPSSQPVVATASVRFASPPPAR